MFGGFARIVFVWEEGKWVVRDLVGARSFVARIGFGLGVGRLVESARSFARFGGIVFVLEVLRGVGLGLVVDNCLGCSRFELEAVVCASVRYKYRSDVIVTVVEVDIEIHCG
jgi:hypothetical protein